MEKPRNQLERKVQEAETRRDEWAFRYHMATDGGALVAADFAKDRLDKANEELRRAKIKLDKATGKGNA